MSPARARSSPALEVTEAGEAGGVGGLGRIILRVFAENKLALVSVGVVVFMLLFCFVGPHIYHTNQTDLVVTNVNQVLAHPSASTSLGTDPNGYDTLGRLMYGGATTLEIALAGGGDRDGFRGLLRGRSPATSVAPPMRS